MPERRTGTNWTWDETLIAFRLYCRTPFGKLHQHNPDIVTLAQKLRRTPSSVGMKACNFASLDPMHQARGVKGLSNASRLEQQVWDRFHADSEAVAAKAEEAYARLTADDETQPPSEPPMPAGSTEESRLVRVRRVQAFFRTTVLTSYGYRCALTGLAVPALLNASHIVPWSVAPTRRADPRNGLCLNALHDRAFDRGLITLSDELSVIVSPALQGSPALGEFAEALTGYAGCRIHIPDRFEPDREALTYHREHIFNRM